MNSQQLRYQFMESSRLITDTSYFPDTIGDYTKFRYIDEVISERIDETYLPDPIWQQYPRHIGNGDQRKQHMADRQQKIIGQIFPDTQQ